MIKYLIALLCAYLSFACSSNYNQSKNKETVSIINSLGENQAKVWVNINGKDFYSDTSVFQGGGYVDQNGVKISLKDQSLGNVIVSIEGNNWFKAKPYRVEFKDGYPISSTMGSFLAGRISDASSNKGLGYMLYDGFFEIAYISKDIFVVNVEGKLKKPFGDDALSSVTGKIVWKKPGYVLEASRGIEIEFPNIKK